MGRKIWIEYPYPFETDGDGTLSAVISLPDNDFPHAQRVCRLADQVFEIHPDGTAQIRINGQYSGEMRLRFDIRDSKEGVRWTGAHNIHIKRRSQSTLTINVEGDQLADNALKYQNIDASVQEGSKSKAVRRIRSEIELQGEDLGSTLKIPKLNVIKPNGSWVMAGALAVVLLLAVLGLLLRQGAPPSQEAPLTIPGNTQTTSSRPDSSAALQKFLTLFRLPHQSTITMVRTSLQALLGDPQQGSASQQRGKAAYHDGALEFIYDTASRQIQEIRLRKPLLKISESLGLEDQSLRFLGMSADEIRQYFGEPLPETDSDVLAYEIVRDSRIVGKVTFFCMGGSNELIINWY